MIHSFDNINDAQLYCLAEIMKQADFVLTRGYITKEIGPLSFSIQNPRKRLTTIKQRKWNFVAAVGELLWHLSGSKDLNTIANYLSEWKNFSKDGFSIDNSCYGYKIFQKEDNGYSKWNKIIEILKKDPGSRRAVLSLYNDKDGLNEFDIDVSCTCTLQFMIRDNKLNLIVYMRSNDAIWGLPYDFFLFSFLQELLSKELGIDLGVYTHMCGSMHIYERHFSLAKKIIIDPKYDRNCSMPAMTSLESYNSFISIEQFIKNNTFSISSILSLQQYWKDLASVLMYHYYKKNSVAIPSDLMSSLSPYFTLL